VEGMSIPGGIESFFFLFVLLFMVVPIIGVIDAALTPNSAWADANQDKIVWIVVQIFLGIFGAVAYFVAIRPKLRAGSAKGEHHTAL
jgi:Phospholipase_D-nuclease N-terminal